MKSKALLFISLCLSIGQGIAIASLDLSFPLYFIYFFTGMIIGRVGVLALEASKEEG